MIPLIKEHPEMYENTRVMEVCHFCKNPTLYWHENTNNPVCNMCAKDHKVGELPDFGKRIRARKRKAAKENYSET